MNCLNSYYGMMPSFGGNSFPSFPRFFLLDTAINEQTLSKKSKKKKKKKSQLNVLRSS